LDRQDFLALEGVIAIGLLLELVDLMPERVVGHCENLICMLLKKLGLIELEGDI